MKYLFRSNIIIFISFFVPGMIMFSFLGDNMFQNDTVYLLGITLLEGFIFKVNYDFINYDHDYKFFVHRLPKKIFYIFSIVFNLSVIVLIILLSSNFKYLLLLSLIFVNCFHILFKKNVYFIPLLPLVLFPNFLLSYHGKEFFMWWGVFTISSIGIAYYIKHRKMRVFTNDNY